MSDPLDEFLDHPPSLPVSANEREATFAATRAHLPIRASRRWPLLAAVAAAVVLLIVSYWLARLAQFAPDRKGDFVEQKKAPNQEKPAPPPPDEPEQPRTKLVHAPMSPRELEWKAFDAEDDQERVRLYFRAGDLFLAANNDIDSALRCYQQALFHSGAEDMQINPNDNWLVMALKRDHRKEK